MNQINLEESIVQFGFGAVANNLILSKNDALLPKAVIFSTALDFCKKIKWVQTGKGFETIENYSLRMKKESEEKAFKSLMKTVKSRTRR